MSGNKRNKSSPFLFALLFTIIIISLLFALGTGAVSIPPRQTLLILGERIPYVNRIFFSIPNKAISESQRAIVFDLRLPRALLALLIGSSLAVAGTTFQGLFNNPMADPYIIGVSAGASLGATIAIALGLRLNFFQLGTIPLCAFFSALLTIKIVYKVAKVGERVPIMNLILSGVAVGSFLSAVASLFTYFSDRRLHQIVFWMMGSLTNRGWNHLRVSIPYVIFGYVVILFFARDLNALLLGEEPAQHLGIEVEKVKRYLILAASLLTATAVAISGLIGFIGLIIPHATRLVVGPDHRVLIPASAFTGAIFLLWIDTLARILLPPLELPVGLLTAFVGGPFFIYLLHKRKDNLL